jgi:lysozyme
MALLDTNPKRVSAAIAAALAIAAPIVAHFEGTFAKSYRDPVGIVTACTGHTGPELRMGQVFTADECSEMLAADLSIAARGVQDCIKVDVSANELAAYTSFGFNAGVAAFCSSTAAKRLNAGDHRGACAELSRWTQARGQVLPGLVRRRAAERALCETP